MSREVSTVSRRKLPTRLAIQPRFHHFAPRSSRVSLRAVREPMASCHRRNETMQDAYAANENAVPTPVRLSRWVNEPYPPITELLSAHDVARLTRRPRWMIWGLRLVGRFPRKARYRGRRVGWRRSDVLEWMARDLALKRDPRSPASSMQRPRQRDLPLQDRAACAATQRDRQTERSQS